MRGLLSLVATGKVEFAEPVTGHVTVDASKCTLCGACSNSCPTGALRVVDSRTGLFLLFDPDHCAACKLCEQACPHGAIRVDYAFEPGSGRERIVARTTVARCARCGKPIGSLAVVRELEEGLRRLGAGDALLRQLWLCAIVKWGLVPREISV